MGHTTYTLPQKIDEVETDDFYYVTEDEFEAIRFKVFNLFYVGTFIKSQNDLFFKS